MERAFTEDNRRKVMAMHLHPMSEAQMAADSRICRTCRGIGHAESPEDGFFRTLCPACGGSGIV